MLRAPALALVALTLGVGATACGGDGDEKTTEQTTSEPTTDENTTTTTSTASAEGREIFTDNCGSCHTLADAGTAGTVGPDLDEIALDATAVAQQVRAGGGGMPAFGGELSDAEIAVVSEYVVEARG
ncbi:MAG TPA: cytochrome c [Gaiellaceae bacterium]|nr:cytochrome c [Gaiellaceae bacterium]